MEISVIMKNEEKMPIRKLFGLPVKLRFGIVMFLLSIHIMEKAKKTSPIIRGENQ